MLPQVDVGVVTWNSASLTTKALRQLLDSDQEAQLRLMVWDNASEDGTAEFVARAVPEAEVICSPENVGFARAVNQLLRRSRAPWFLALNSDAWPEAHAVGKLVAAANAHPRAAAVAPKLQHPDGVLEHSTHPFPSMGLAVVDALGLRRALPRRWAADHCLEGAWAHDRARQVDWAVGAALLLRREAVEDVGGFDERCFLYVEDLEWCFRARSTGWEIWFEPAAVVHHVGNVSGERRFGEQRAALEGANLRRFLAETLGPGQASLHHRLQTVAAARCYAGARWSGQPGEQAHWRRQLRAALGLIPPPVLVDADDDSGRHEDGDAPRVTVVVSTRNRCERLEGLVAALEKQSLPADAFEVVIVDNCTTDGTSATLATLARDSQLRLRALRTSKPGGPAAARNLGWKAARAPVVAFTDDDCLPDPHWLEEGLAAMEDRARVVVGRTRPPADQLGLVGRPFARVMQVDSPRFFETCNVFYRRRDLETVGGFDERFGQPNGEDTHLGIRVSELGVQAVYAEAAVVYHDVRPGGALAALSEATRWTDLPLVFHGRAYARRGRVHRYVFWKESHPPAMLAAVGLLLALRWRPALVLLWPWMRYRLEQNPVCQRRRLRLATLPAALAVDLTEVAVMVRGSLRHRTILL